MTIIHTYIYTHRNLGKRRGRGIWQSTGILLERPGRQGLAELACGLKTLSGHKGRGKDLMFVSKWKGKGSRQRKEGSGRAAILMTTQFWF